MFIDTHAHLMFKEFDADLAEVILRARERGVKKTVNVGCGIEYAQKAVEMQKSIEEKFPDFLYATVGLHPYDAGDLSEELMQKWEELMMKNEKVVAVGETGLDYFKAQVPKEVQRASFVRHLELARKCGVPVIIHNREADIECLEILDEFNNLEKSTGRVDAVFHCYGSSLDFARKLWNRGYYTSFTGIITYPNAENLREVVRQAPVDKILIETDCPYLAPQKVRGKRNEPANVVEVAEKIAEVRGMDLDELEKQLEKNTKEFFKRLC